MKNPVPSYMLGQLLDRSCSLDKQTAYQRLLTNGENRILGPREKRFKVLIDTLKDPMIWFLVLAAFLFLFAGEIDESIILIAAIIPIIALDSFLHRRTALSTASLANNLSIITEVFRDGIRTHIDTTQLVPGDLIFLSNGEYIPADVIVLDDMEARLQVDESSLSGEVDPVLKKPLKSIVSDDIKDPLIDHSHWLFAGCRVVSGKVLARVVYTGSSTIYGDLIRTARGQKNESTILQKSIHSLIIRILGVSIVLCALLAYIRISQGHSYTDAFMSAAVLALAALPEEFPIVFSFYLGYSVYRLSRHKILVRHAAGVEHVGRVSVICADKTGTITEGVLTLKKIIAQDGFSEDEVLSCARMATQKDSVDPLDLAILERKSECKFSDPIHVEPFNEKNKFERITYRDSNNQTVVVTKGAPETMIDACVLTQAERKSNRALVSQYASEGYKLLGCMIHEHKKGGRDLPKLIGYLCFSDTIKSHVMTSIKACKDMGIRVIMVTGDHYDTALSISESIGLHQKGLNHAVSVDEGDINWSDLAKDPLLTVVARALPKQKYNLVTALKEQGNVTAVTGDGVNDILALKAADVSLVMGERGTKGARDIASMVLMNDSFNSITDAIMEGKRLFANLKQSYIYLVSIHFPFVISSAVLPALGYPLVFLPIHVVLIEMILHPTSLLCFHDVKIIGNESYHLSQDKVRKYRFFQRRDLLKMSLLGLLSTAMLFFTFDRALTYEGVTYARSLAFYQIALFSISLALSIGNTVSKNASLVAFLILVSLAIFHMNSDIARYLDLTRISLKDWYFIIGWNLGLYILNRYMLNRIS